MILFFARIILISLTITNGLCNDDADYHFNWESTPGSTQVRFQAETPKPKGRSKSHHHVHKTGIIDLKPGSFITFSSKNNESSVKVQSMTNQTYSETSIQDSFRPNVVNLTMTQTLPAENSSDDGVRLLDSITFPDEVSAAAAAAAAKSTAATTTIIITTITNSTTTITFSTDGNNMKATTLPTTRSDMSSITTTTVITTPVEDTKARSKPTG